MVWRQCDKVGLFILQETSKRQLRPRYPAWAPDRSLREHHSSLIMQSTIPYRNFPLNVPGACTGHSQVISALPYEQEIIIMSKIKEPGGITYKFTRKELQNSLKYNFKSTPENKILELCLHRSMSKRKRKYNAALSFYHVATELRECVLRNQWSDAVHLMLIFLDAPKRLLPLIWQYSFKILLNHPSGGPEILEEFIQMTTGVTKPRELIQSLLTKLKYV